MCHANFEERERERKREKREKLSTERRHSSCSAFLAEEARATLVASSLASQGRGTCTL